MRSRKLPTGERRRSEKEGAASGAGKETRDILIAVASWRAVCRRGASPASLWHGAAGQARRVATLCAFAGMASFCATVGGVWRGLASLEALARSSQTDLTTKGGSNSAPTERHRRVDMPVLNALANSAQARIASSAWRPRSAVMRCIESFSSPASPSAQKRSCSGILRRD